MWCRLCQNSAIKIDIQFIIEMTKIQAICKLRTTIHLIGNFDFLNWIPYNLINQTFQFKLILYNLVNWQIRFTKSDSIQFSKSAT